MITNVVARAGRPTVGVLVAGLMVLAGCTTGGRGARGATASTPGSPTVTSSPPGAASSRQPSSRQPAPSTPASTPTRTHQPNKPVHIQLKFSDGQTFGVGIPVIAFFSRRITDASALQAATTVTVDGRTVTGGRWYFEPVSGHPGYPIEGDYRLRHPWRAHAQIFVDIPAKGLPAGRGLAYDDSLTLRFTTGPAQIARVNDATHTLTLRVDGAVEGTYPVSLGAPDTRTLRGTKVIMEKGVDIPMSGPGYDDPHVKYTQRLTYGGEYLHSAPWNCSRGRSPGCVGPANNIGHANSSNGCTNLLPVDAEKLFGILRIGDLVEFPDADGPKMTMGEGYGDWNVPWTTWLTGGDVARI